MKQSSRSIIKNKLADEYCVYLNKNMFYIAVCSFNDNVLKTKNFTSAIEILMNSKGAMEMFADYIFNEFQPVEKS